MMCRRVTTVEGAASLFEQNAHGLHRMGIFPYFSGTPYKNEEFYKELEVQQTTLSRPKHLVSSAVGYSQDLSTSHHLYESC